MFPTSNDFLTSVDKELLSQHLQELPYDLDYINFLNMGILKMKPYMTALVNKMIVIICCRYGVIVIVNRNRLQSITVF